MPILEGLFPELAKAGSFDTKGMADKHFADVAAELQTLRRAIDKYEGIDRHELELSGKFITKRDFGIYVSPGSLAVQISDSSSFRNHGFPFHYRVDWNNGKYQFKYNDEDSIRGQDFSGIEPLIIASTKRLLHDCFLPDEVACIEQHILNANAIDVTTQHEPRQLLGRINNPNSGDRPR